MKIANGHFYHGDCLEVMRGLPAGSVDMVLCDLPYGTTACSWDSIIPFEPLWAQYWRIAKPNAAIVLTASQPFTTALIASQIKRFKYCWVWEKSRFSNQLLAKIQPLKIHEDVCVFAKGKTPYNPQGLVEVNRVVKQGSRVSDNNGGGSRKTAYTQTHTGYPKSIIQVPSAGGTVHPTQKPVALFEYLIRTYTQPGETVLDNCLGSGTTAIAAERSGRRWIGIERDEGYYNAALERIRDEGHKLL